MHKFLTYIMEKKQSKTTEQLQEHFLEIFNNQTMSIEEKTDMIKAIQQDINNQLTIIHRELSISNVQEEKRQEFANLIERRQKLTHEELLDSMTEQSDVNRFILLEQERRNINFLETMTSVFFEIAEHSFVNTQIEKLSEIQRRNLTGMLHSIEACITQSKKNIEQTAIIENIIKSLYKITKPIAKRLYTEYAENFTEDGNLASSANNDEVEAMLSEINYNYSLDTNLRHFRYERLGTETFGDSSPVSKVKNPKNSQKNKKDCKIF